jgi:hypothetical protein
MGNCSVETITHPFLSSRHLERDEESWRDARETLTYLIYAAKSLGARSIYMLTGERLRLCHTRCDCRSEGFCRLFPSQRAVTVWPGRGREAAVKQIQEGYLERRENPDDRRAYCVYLTPDAQPVLDKLDELAKIHEGVIFAGFNAQDLEKLDGLLDTIATNLSEFKNQREAAK